MRTVKWLLSYSYTYYGYEMEKQVRRQNISATKSLSYENCSNVILDPSSGVLSACFYGRSIRGSNIDAVWRKIKELGTCVKGKRNYMGKISLLTYSQN